MASFEALLDRLDRLLFRYEEAQRRQALLEAQLASITLERDSLRSRLAAARGRIDALLDRLPPESAAAGEAAAPAGHSADGPPLAAAAPTPPLAPEGTPSGA